jgi:hypothetical protein
MVSVKSGQDWGPWLPTEGECFKTGRFWAKADVSGKKGDSVRVRAVYNGSGAPGWIEFFGLDASSMEGEEGAGAGAGDPSKVAFSVQEAAPASPIIAPKPDIQPRSAWGAKPAAKPYEPMLGDRITVHHTESGQPMSRAAAIAELQAIQSFHQHGRGWIDIGYHFIIDGTGQIWEGRPFTVVGAHVKDKNDGNIGISLMGDFQKPKNQHPTAAQFESLVALARWLSAAYNIPTERILGHRDQEQTTCPGDILYARLGELRKDVASSKLLAQALAPHTDALRARIESLPIFSMAASDGRTLFDFDEAGHTAGKP